jgi:hypothetical protein
MAAEIDSTVRQRARHSFASPKKVLKLEREKTQVAVELE